jgi:hypothetical protein
MRQRTDRPILRATCCGGAMRARINGSNKRRALADEAALFVRGRWFHTSAVVLRTGSGSP